MDKIRITWVEDPFAPAMYGGYWLYVNDVRMDEWYIGPMSSDDKLSWYLMSPELAMGDGYFTHKDLSLAKYDLINKWYKKGG